MQWDRDTMIGESTYEWMNVLSRMNLQWFQIYWLGLKSCAIVCPHLLLLDWVTWFSVICPKVTVIKSFSLRRLRIHLHILLLGQVVQILSMLLEVFASKCQSQILRGVTACPWSQEINEVIQSPSISMQFKVSMNEIRIILWGQMGETSGLIKSLSLGKDQTSPSRVKLLKLLYYYPLSLSISFCHLTLPQNTYASATDFEPT